ncbi:hypothetical protein E1B28_001849 [Marasmius oreades]|uniref:Uncharacterized protein n=1 Tax=Marasmius oreades TaxID=181124 RepID=A0A9P8AG70_9AGAR|nr:uncharacterized protein E1B28_001849 [Marasmius oreades]KAG7100065.1 hypothetical protein E1B28_001849 [Marasmius oreades]
MFDINDGDGFFPLILVPGVCKCSPSTHYISIPTLINAFPPASLSLNDSDDSDEDNAPLATLLPPRRPGSALSSRSNSSLNGGRAPPSSFTSPLNASQQEGSRSMSVYSTSTSTPNPPASTSNYATSVSSQGSSTNSRRPAPLIDINKLTGPNRTPLSSGVATKGPEKSKEGFTEGYTLLSGVSGGRPRSPEKNRQAQARASSPTKSIVSTTAPANKKFVSPPSSPVGSVFSHTPGPRRGMPKKKETGMSDVSASGSSGGAKRDVISERLKGVIQGKMLGDDSGSRVSVFNSAPDSKALPSVPTGSSQHLRAPAVLDDSDSDEDEEEEEEEEDDDERYGTTEGTIKGKQPLRAPQLRPVANATPRALTAPAAPPRSRSPAPETQPQRTSPSPSPSPQPRRLTKSPVSQNEPSSPAAASTSTSTSTSPKPASQPSQPYKRPQPANVQQPKQPQTRRGSASSVLDIDLASVLGGGIRLISFDNKESDSIVFPPSPSDTLPPIPSIVPVDRPPPSPNRIAPVVVRERERTPAFSVTSRPKHKGGSASVSGVVTLGSSTTETQMKEEEEKKDVEGVATAVASTWTTRGAGDVESTTTSTTSTANASSTLGRPRSGSLSLLSTVPTLTTNTTTNTTTMTTTTQVLQIPLPPRSSSLQPRSTADSPTLLSTSPSSQKAPLPVQGQKEKEKRRGFAFGLQTSRSSSALGSNASATSGSSSSSGGGSSGVESRTGSGDVVDGGPNRQGQVLGKDKLQANLVNKHARRTSAGAISMVSEMTMRPPARVQPSPSPSPSSSSSQLSRQQQLQRPPPMKPFSAIPPMSRGSPATSSTGGSSGRAPVTPRDGSELGIRGLDDVSKRNEHRPQKQKEWSGGASGLGMGHGRKRSVAFEEEDGEGTVSGKSGKGREVVDEESKRKERRRGEAKAAIELGNVINGRGPIVEDDDEDLPIGQFSNVNSRMNIMNPTLMPPNGGFPATFGWNPANPAAGAFPPNAGQMQLSPAQFMVPPPADPRFLSAHQQAMMYAKQAYQMAVAQQAMAAAADEWERGSAVGFSSSQSMYGGFGGSTGSVYGGLGGGNGWSTGSVIFPQVGPRVQTYGMSGAKSDYGGGGGWGNNSVYGDSSYGRQERMRTQSTVNPGNRTSTHNGQRDSMAFNMPPPPIPQQKSAPALSKGGPGGRNRTLSQPASPRSTRPGKAPPPSSWKPGM